MTSFLIAAFLLLVLVLVLLLRPFIYSRKDEGTSRRQMNVAIYRDELEKLEAERIAGTINIQEYEMSHAEMRQRLFQDTTEEDDHATMGSPAKTMIGICIFIILISVGLYIFLGDGVRVAQQVSQKPVSQEAVQKMVTEFAAKMEKDPDNLKGWAMLARSYRILGQTQDAAKAYGHAGVYLDSDPELLAEYADTLATIANGNFSGKPLQLINQALKIDPNNFLALWLSGTASYTSGNYKAAVQTWEKLAKQLPPNTDEARAIQGSIAEARTKGGLSAPAVVVSGKDIGGVVELSAELKSKVKPGDVLMIIARQPGERMPVAVLRESAGEFPVRFVLNDALAMNPNQPLSKLSEVSLEVRISKTGMAKPEAGDLLSSPQTVKVGTNQVHLIVNQVRQ